MKCRFCGARIGILERWRFGDFCSKEHKDEFAVDLVRLNEQIVKDLRRIPTLYKSSTPEAETAAGQPPAIEQPDPPEAIFVFEADPDPLVEIPQPKPAEDAPEKKTKSQQWRIFSKMADIEGLPPSALAASKEKEDSDKYLWVQLGEQPQQGPQGVLLATSFPAILPQHVLRRLQGHMPMSSIRVPVDPLRTAAEDARRYAVGKTTQQWIQEHAWGWMAEALAATVPDLAPVLSAYPISAPWANWAIVPPSRQMTHQPQNAMPMGGAAGQAGPMPPPDSMGGMMAQPPPAGGPSGQPMPPGGMPPGQTMPPSGMFGQPMAPGGMMAQPIPPGNLPLTAPQPTVMQMPAPSMAGVPLPQPVGLNLAAPPMAGMPYLTSAPAGVPGVVSQPPAGRPASLPSGAMPAWPMAAQGLTPLGLAPTGAVPASVAQTYAYAAPRIVESGLTWRELPPPLFSALVDLGGLLKVSSIPSVQLVPEYSSLRPTLLIAGNQPRFQAELSCGMPFVDCQGDPSEDLVPAAPHKFRARCHPRTLWRRFLVLPQAYGDVGYTRIPDIPGPAFVFALRTSIPAPAARPQLQIGRWQA
ncbi:hypothetical protein [Paludibaculum fermentans]|uniref:Uncharacterized protein n=1 Tax=Paludibaculum fermentans TaxID=1473598 RepID=A0A7S7NX36_PALFE|nr:hypothetical protein [Paludibaculum fermentans]QOY91398.1 hypothetical protein IRI77_16035 [Paludibaculum fermentans]